MSTSIARTIDAPAPHYWTIDEYHRAIDAGVFGDKRVELLHGQVVEMPPMNEPHIGAGRYMAELFFARLGWQRTSSQTPIILPSDSEPEPDVAVFELGAPLKPGVDQVQLVIEVAQSTRRRDLGRNSRTICALAYARSGSSTSSSSAHSCTAMASWLRAIFVAQVHCWSPSSSLRSASISTRSSAQLA